MCHIRKKLAHEKILVFSKFNKMEDFITSIRRIKLDNIALKPELRKFNYNK